MLGDKKGFFVGNNSLGNVCENLGIGLSVSCPNGGVTDTYVGSFRDVLKFYGYICGGVFDDDLLVGICFVPSFKSVGHVVTGGGLYGKACCRDLRKGKRYRFHTCT